MRTKMKMKTNLGLIAIAAVILSGCATSLRLVPQKMDGQELVFEQGLGAISSEDSKVNTVTVRPNSSTYTASDAPAFSIRVKNGTGKPLDLSPRDIQIKLTLDGTERDTSVLDLDQMLVRLENKRRAKNVGSFLSGVAGFFVKKEIDQALGQHKDRTYTTIEADDDSIRVGRTTVTADAQLAGDQLSEFSEAKKRNDAEAAEDRERLQREMLRPTTIPAGGESADRAVYFVGPGKDHGSVPVKVIVNVGGEVHEFEFLQESVSG